MSSPRLTALLALTGWIGADAVRLARPDQRALFHEELLSQSALQESVPRAATSLLDRQGEQSIPGLARTIAAALAFGGPPGQQKMRMVAHRGSSCTAPENTLASIRLAFEQGAAGVEFDIQRSADGHLFLLHDDTLLRTASFEPPEELREFLTLEDWTSKLNTDVSQLSFQDFIQYVDVGSWKYTRNEHCPLPELLQLDPSIWRFEAERPMLLGSALEAVPDGHFALVEIKGGDRETATAVVNFLTQSAVEPFKVVLIGIDLGLMSWMKQELARDDKAGQVRVISVKHAETETSALEHIEKAASAGLDGVDFEANPDVVTEKVIRLAQEKSLFVGVWVWREGLQDGGDTFKNVQDFANLKLDFFTSDFPASLLDWVGQHSPRSRSAERPAQ